MNPEFHFLAPEFEFETPEMEFGTYEMEFASAEFEFRTPEMEIGTKKMEFASPEMEFGARKMEFGSPEMEFGSQVATPFEGLAGVKVADFVRSMVSGGVHRTADPTRSAGVKSSPVAQSSDATSPGRHRSQEQATV